MLHVTSSVSYTLKTAANNLNTILSGVPVGPQPARVNVTGFEAWIYVAALQHGQQPYPCLVTWFVHTGCNMEPVLLL